RLDPDPRRNLPTSSRVPVRRAVVHSGPGQVGTQSGDNYSAGRYPDVPPSSALNLDGAGAGILFISSRGEQLKYILQLLFKATNNAAEYEALIHDLGIAASLG